MPEQQTLPRGLRNNNPLNIRRNPANHWKGAKTTINDKSFEEFRNIFWGIRAAAIIIRNWLGNKRLNIRTVSQIINRWAPASENNTQEYIKTVCQVSGLKPNDSVKFSEKWKMCALLQAMAFVECGIAYKDKLGYHLFEMGYAYAINPPTVYPYDTKDE